MGPSHLAELHGTRLEELLEHDPVLAALAGCHSNAVLFQSLSYFWAVASSAWLLSYLRDGQVGQNIIWVGRLLNPMQLELTQLKGINLSN